MKKYTRNKMLYSPLPCSSCGKEIKIGEVYYHKNIAVNYYEGCVDNEKL